MLVHAAPKAPASSTNVSLHTPNTIQTREKAIDNLLYKENRLTVFFQKLGQKAQSENININKLSDKLTRILLDRPQIQTKEQEEVWLLYETTMLTILSNQMIRKMAKSKIMEAAREARLNPELRNMIGLINDCEQFLLQQLPPKKPNMLPVENSIMQYLIINQQIEEMCEKILMNAKKISFEENFVLL